MLDDDRHRVGEDLTVDVVGAEQQQGPRPVDRLGDRRRLLEVELADHGDDLDELARDRVAELGGVELDDLELVLERRVVEPQVQAAALERLGELARVVGGQQHDRARLGLVEPELGDRELEVAQQLEQHRLELLVGLVDLVDEQDDGLVGGDGGHQRALEQELGAEDVVLDLLPAGALGLGLDAQQLLAVVPLVERLGLVEPLVALQAHERAVEVLRERLGQLGLAHPGRPLDQDRLAQLGGQVGDERGRLAGQVPGAPQARADVLDAGWRGHWTANDRNRIVWGLLPLGFSYDPSPPFGTDPRPFVAMMIAGFVIGVFGHIIARQVARGARHRPHLPGDVRLPAGGEHPQVGVLSGPAVRVALAALRGAYCRTEGRSAVAAGSLARRRSPSRRVSGLVPIWQQTRQPCDAATTRGAPRAPVAADSFPSVPWSRSAAQRTRTTERYARRAMYGGLTSREG